MNASPLILFEPDLVTTFTADLAPLLLGAAAAPPILHPMLSHEIRTSFRDFFAQRDHVVDVVLDQRRGRGRH